MAGSTSATRSAAVRACDLCAVATQLGNERGRVGGVAGAGSSAGGGWRLRGVQVEDELQALPKLHVKCLSATIAFSFDS